MAGEVKNCTKGFICARGRGKYSGSDLKISIIIVCSSDRVLITYTAQV
jgi:hypothetical protein